MDEQQWVSPHCPVEPLLNHLRDRYHAGRTRAGKRKLRLFACACARQVFPLLENPVPHQHYVEIAERFADGLASREELAGAEVEALNSLVTRCRENGGLAGRALAEFVSFRACHSRSAEAARRVARDSDFAFNGGNVALGPDVLSTQAALLRDIFGNPFRPLESRTFPGHITGLAESCYSSFPEINSDFLILADALEDLGEEAAAAHCREELHVKGCHVIDWVLAAK
jgi:hypothetical protein